MNVALVRYGAVPEVARAGIPAELTIRRDDEVIVETHRGLEPGKVLELIKPPVEPGVEVVEPSFQIQRLKTEADCQQEVILRERVQAEFDDWYQRIEDWGLDLQLIDIDWTLDGEKQILYVLNERGPECTKLALQAAAAGLGIIEVQPVGEDGPVAMPSSGGGGGCGSCGSH
ncbi:MULTISPECIES: hypothetical protein [Thalassoglobus]|uniref:PSP1 C-terminal domain-containing protein n=1 Tax=Thalassoglobus polymorphus TaxID=2527994 RepID=A0A517QGV4_9PLAN|nr:hypothetical protein [Thalassoglobus polymorphus]QDT30869.1 hypothetical protein Mal48_00970 [Thalassoglobus polymorphus]